MEYIFGGIILWMLALTLIVYSNRVNIRILEERIEGLKDKYITPEKLEYWWYGNFDKYYYRGSEDRSGALKTSMERIEMLAKHQGLRFTYTVPQPREMILTPVDPEVKQ